MIKLVNDMRLKRHFSIHDVFKVIEKSPMDLESTPLELDTTDTCRYCIMSFKEKQQGHNTLSM